MIKIKMPKLSPTMEEGYIVKWHKNIGDKVELNDVLFEVTTDKATVEYNSFDEGFLKEILVEAGKSALVNEDVAIFTAKEDEIVEEKPKKQENIVRISPLAKKLAKELKIDLSTIEGSGPNGRIISKDIEKYKKPSIIKEEVIKKRKYEEEELSPIRKHIANRLQESKQNIPHFYIQKEINVSSIFAKKEELKKSEFKITINDFIIKAVAKALEKHPIINTGYKNKIIKCKTVDIAVAVSINEGVITPIIFDANLKNIKDISKEVKNLINLANEGRLQEHQYKGGSFTITNLGMYGVLSFQSIINPPQCCILAVGGIKDSLCLKDSAVISYKSMILSLSCDHRVIDGKDAAEFLNTLKDFLENPSILLL